MELRHFSYFVALAEFFIGVYRSFDLGSRIAFDTSGLVDRAACSFNRVP
jgi:hypothetical protein